MFRRVATGLDLWLALILAGGAYWLIPQSLNNDMARDIYEAGISVLSIVFAVFFTALAVIIAAGDDDFVWYLRGLKVYDDLVSVFRFTLTLLFVALMFSIAAFVFSVIRPGCEQPWYLMVTFCFIFSWGLFATMGSTRDALNYATYRMRFLEATRQDGRKPGPASADAADAP